MLEIHSTPKEEKEGRAARLTFHVQDLNLTLSKPANALLPSLVKGRKTNYCLTINQINQLVIAKTGTAEKRAQYESSQSSSLKICWFSDGELSCWRRREMRHHLSITITQVAQQNVIYKLSIRTSLFR